MKKRKPKGGSSATGRPRTIPEGWERRAYFVAPWTAYAIGALAHAEGVQPSILVNRVLTQYTLERKASVPRSGKGFQPPGRAEVP